MTIKLVHAADLHIDSPLRGLTRYEGAPVERIRGATRRALVNLVDLCLSEEAALLLLAGDLFDGDWRDYSTGLFFARQMARLKAGGVRVAMIRGNHDAQGQMTKHLELPDNVSELPTIEPGSVLYEDLELAVHGQGFATREVRVDLAERYPVAVSGLCNIGLLHTSLGGRSGHEHYAGTTLDVLRQKGYDYWALGHVHSREVVCEDPWVVFPGNLQGRHARETGAKGATLIEIDGGGVRSVSHRVLDVVRFAQIAIDLAGVHALGDVPELARSAFADAVAAAEGRLLAARLVLRGETRAHAELLHDRDKWLEQLRACAFDVADDGLWLEKVLIETTSPLGRSELADRADAVGQLVASLSALRGDAAGQAELLELFSDLRRRLPAAAAEGEDGLRLDDPAVVESALDGVEDLLLSALLGERT